MRAAKASRSSSLSPVRQAGHPYRYPKNCTFEQGRRLVLSIDESKHVCVRRSDIPGAGAGLKALKDFQVGDVVVEFKGHLVASFSHDKKLVSMVVQGHKAHLLQDDSYVLFCDGVSSRITGGVRVAYGLEPYSRPRYLNSSHGSREPNLTIKALVSPKIIESEMVSTEAKKVDVREGQFFAPKVCVLGVATKAIKKQDELLFPYRFSDPKSYLHDPAKLSAVRVREVLKRVDPSGDAFRTKHGWCHDSNSRMTLEMLADCYSEISDKELSEPLIRCYQRLLKAPHERAIQNELVRLGEDHPEFVTQVLLACYLYKDGEQPSRVDMYLVCRRLNFLKQANLIHSGCKWRHKDVYRYALRHRLIAPAHEMQMMPLGYIADELRCDREEPLVCFVKDYLASKAIPGSLVCNLCRNDVPVFSGGGRWTMDTLALFCRQHKITLPEAEGDYRGDLEDKQCRLHWMHCRSGNVKQIWSVLNNYCSQGCALSFMVKKLGGHGVDLGIPLEKGEALNLGHLWMFIKRTGSSAQVKAWRNRLTKDIKCFGRNMNFSRMLTKAVLTSKDEWLLCRALEARIRSPEISTSVLIRNLNAKNPGAFVVEKWTTTTLYLWLQQQEPDLARLFLSIAGPRVKKVLISACRTKTCQHL